MSAKRKHVRKRIEPLSPRQYLCQEFNFARMSTKSERNIARFLAAARLTACMLMKEQKLEKLVPLREGFDLAVEYYGGIRKNPLFTTHQRSILYRADDTITAQMKAATTREMRGGASTYIEATRSASPAD